MEVVYKLINSINRMHFVQTQNQKTAHQAKAFVITCMDFRLIDDVVYFMNGLGFNNNYDEFILAGASLGFTQDKYPHWGQTLLDHMNIGLTLHHFRQIIFIDHIQCGAYKKFYTDMKTEEDQICHHRECMNKTKRKLAELFPNFRFRGFLMNLDGKCTEIHEYVSLEKSQIDQNTEEFLDSLSYHL